MAYADWVKNREALRTQLAALPPLHAANVHSAASLNVRAAEARRRAALRAPLDIPLVNDAGYALSFNTDKYGNVISENYAGRVNAYNSGLNVWEARFVTSGAHTANKRTHIELLNRGTRARPATFVHGARADVGSDIHFLHWWGVSHMGWNKATPLTVGMMQSASLNVAIATHQTGWNASDTRGVITAAAFVVCAYFAATAIAGAGTASAAGGSSAATVGSSPSALATTASTTTAGTTTAGGAGAATAAGSASAATAGGGLTIAGATETITGGTALIAAVKGAADTISPKKTGDSITPGPGPAAQKSSAAPAVMGAAVLLGLATFLLT